jgi:nitrate/TMAO reductase-like tetraheme cytochrome c subunit
MQFVKNLIVSAVLYRVRWMLQICMVALIVCPTPPTIAQGIESIVSPGKVIQGHQKIEDDCKLCHTKFDRKAQDGLCMDCHKEIAKDVLNKMGFHGRLKPQTCRSCHTDHKGRDVHIADFDKKKFDHTQTDFNLRGKHAKVECDKCHLPSKKYRDAATDCNACHRKDDIHKGSLGVKCESCHNESNWKETKFDHDATRFALTGKHSDVKCADCHKTANYKETPRNCIGCHKKDDEGKGHKGLYGEKCESCHTTKLWKPSTFKHDVDTKYVLKGAHRTSTCASCHTGHLYRVKLSQDCYACHKKDDKHKETLGKNCGNCHAERSWKEVTKFDHNKSDFPLLGKHSKVECKDCHKSALFKEAPKDCYSCHKKDDKHKETLGKSCGNCHTERDWKEVTKFDHNKSDFPLLGKHSKVECKDCHKSALFKEAPKDCYSCHKKDDKHKETLGKSCGNCHTERDWKEVTKFDHNKSDFPLLGKHSKVECKDCHKSALFKEAPKDCYSCHKKDDLHLGNLGEKCASCHSENDWKTTQDRFKHDDTRFKLRNAHASPVLKCNACHVNLKSYRNTPMDCYSCHKKDDRHDMQEGPKCEQCHDDKSWKIARFDHNVSRFPLTGGHAVVKCASCHLTIRFKDAPRDCYSCHQKVDKHKLKFGVQCEACHNTRAWAIWDYNHELRAKYKLDGAHLSISCESCHTQVAPKGRNAAFLGATCISCHRNQDVHGGRFGARCEQCHSTDNWKSVKTRVGSRGSALL